MTKQKTPQGAEILPPKRQSSPSASKPSVWGQIGKWAAQTVAEGARALVERTRVEAKVQRCPRCGVVYLSANLYERGADPGSPAMFHVEPHICDDLLPPKPPKSPKTGGQR